MLRSYRLSEPDQDDIDRLISTLQRFFVSGSSGQELQSNLDKLDYRPLFDCIVHGGHSFISFEPDTIGALFGRPDPLPSRAMFEDILNPDSKIQLSTDSLQLAKRLQCLF